MILALIRIYFQPAASLVPASHIPTPAELRWPGRLGEGGKGGGGIRDSPIPENFQVSCWWQGQGEGMCPALADPRERSQRGCRVSPTVKKSPWDFLRPREGWVTGLPASCVDSLCRLSGPQFPYLALTRF